MIKTAFGAPIDEFNQNVAAGEYTAEDLAIGNGKSFAAMTMDKLKQLGTNGPEAAAAGAAPGTDPGFIDNIKGMAQGMIDDIFGRAKDEASAAAAAQQGILKQNVSTATSPIVYGLVGLGVLVVAVGVISWKRK